MKKTICRTITAFLFIFALLISTAGCTGDIQTARNAINGVVYIEGRGINDSGNIFDGSGTGFAEGIPGSPVEYIATAAHVVIGNYMEGSNPRVYFSGATNDFMNTEIMICDYDKDVALLRLPEPTTKRTALTICPKASADLTEKYTLLGYPGLATDATDLVKASLSDVVITEGIISKADRFRERGLSL